MKTLLFGFIIMTSFPSTSHAQGGHVNGPDLQGNSIPLFSENEIPIEKLQAATEYCYQEAGETILSLLLGRNIRLEKHKVLGSSEYFSCTPIRRWPNNTTHMSCSGNFTAGKGASGRSNDLIVRPSDTIGVKPKGNLKDYYFSALLNASNSEFNVNYRYGLETSGNELYISIAAEKLPELSFDLIDRSTYGEMGETIQSRRYAARLRFNKIHMPDGASLERWPLTTDGRGIKPTLNFQNVIDCINSKIAEK